MVGRRLVRAPQMAGGGAGRQSRGTVVPIPSAGLRTRRHALRLRQTDLAASAGVSERFVRQLEAGKPSVRLDVLTKVLDTLGLELVLRLRTGDHP